ncbi:hypothetical protein C8T65DRAFT_60336 [Cerioporus squamosus]|nr:hypothetical protein C8T65DRAFT_60336 [Cerioporus squamosus]
MRSQSSIRLRTSPLSQRNHPMSIRVYHCAKLIPRRERGTPIPSAPSEAADVNSHSNNANVVHRVHTVPSAASPSPSLPKQSNRPSTRAPIFSSYHPCAFCSMQRPARLPNFSLRESRLQYGECIARPSPSKSHKVCRARPRTTGESRPGHQLLGTRQRSRSRSCDKQQACGSRRAVDSFLDLICTHGGLGMYPHMVPPFTQTHWPRGGTRASASAQGVSLRAANCVRSVQLTLLPGLRTMERKCTH